jgi:hypothetical protein
MKSVHILGLLAALVVGLAGGFGIARLLDDGSTGAAEAEAAMSAEMSSPSPAASAMHVDDHATAGEMGDMHEAYEVPAAQAPSVSLKVVEDAKSGWNVMLTTDQFTFTPENVNGENVVGEGHAHLYVDGVKVARLYGPYFHYPESFDGTRTFRATLNANDHSEYAVDGQVIEAVVDVTHEHHE